MIAEESLSVQLACRLLEVTRAGYYAAASRPTRGMRLQKRSSTEMGEDQDDPTPAQSFRQSKRQTFLGHAEPPAEIDEIGFGLGRRA